MTALVELDPDCLTIRTARSADACTISVGGDVDATSAPALGRCLQEAFDRVDAVDVLLDLSGVTFLDSAGLTVLVGAHRAAQRAHRALRLRCGVSRAVLRPLAITGLSTALTIIDAPPAGGGRS
jgi:anti-sigma B factor antagonist